MHIDAEAVLDFWFGPQGSASTVAGRQRALWFGKSAEADRAVTQHFATTLADARAGRLDRWADTPRGRLALVIVLDQFPHHVFRDQPQAFASDAQALALSLAALDAQEERMLAPIERVFLYLPLEHAESLEMQTHSVALFEGLAQEAAVDERALFENFLDYARQHRDVVARFGRFPHRNEILGRASSTEEIEFLKQPGSRF
jgi:uncharacterized protein (DUF924 family)